MALFGVDSRWLFVGLIVLVVIERLVELALTKRNARRLRQRGGHEVGEEHFPLMAAMHTALLVAAPLEVFWFDRPLWPPLAVAMLILLACTMALRYWAVTSLGDRWTARIFVVPGEAPVVRGPYRFLRHPNYLAVIGEVAVLPLVHGAWLTAVAFSLANAAMLRLRIRVEEEALAASSDYDERLGGRPRLLPGTAAGSGEGSAVDRSGDSG